MYYQLGLSKLDSESLKLHITRQPNSGMKILSNISVQVYSEIKKCDVWQEESKNLREKKKSEGCCPAHGSCETTSCEFGSPLGDIWSFPCGIRLSIHIILLCKPRRCCLLSNSSADSTEMRASDGRQVRQQFICLLALTLATFIFREAGKLPDYAREASVCEGVSGMMRIIAQKGWHWLKKRFKDQDKENYNDED